MNPAPVTDAPAAAAAAVAPVARPVASAVSPGPGTTAAAAPARRRKAPALQQRLMLMLIAPLVAVVLLNVWFDYRAAASAAPRRDEELLALLPLLADSVIAPPLEPGQPPLLLLAPPIESFLRAGPRAAAYAIVDADGRLLHGAAWLADLPPTSTDPQLRNEEWRGVIWRVVRQRVDTAGGELTVALADGSDARQQWAASLLTKVLLPNLALIVAAALGVRWAVRRALRPLLDLTNAVQSRSPRDLSPIDDASSPAEVRPLVRALNRLFGMVNAQAEGQRRFIADAAHQLRTPLAGLQAQVEAWAQAAAAAEPGDGHEEPGIRLPGSQVNKLRQATRRTSQLANQLLALSRADARTMQAQPTQRVALKALAEDILQLHLDAAAARRIDLGLEARPVSVPGHDWLLRELLSNLVDNAIKYTPEGGTVTIRCGWRGSGPFLEVEDDGPGIPAAERARATERFYRIRGTTGEGNGLGLAIADEIARAHHAQLLLAEGGKGRGLRVSVDFPGLPVRV